MMIPTSIVFLLAVHVPLSFAVRGMLSSAEPSIHGKAARNATQEGCTCQEIAPVDDKKSEQACICPNFVPGQWVSFMPEKNKIQDGTVLECDDHTCKILPDDAKDALDIPVRLIAEVKAATGSPRFKVETGVCMWPYVDMDPQWGTSEILCQHAATLNALQFKGLTGSMVSGLTVGLFGKRPTCYVSEEGEVKFKKEGTTTKQVEGYSRLCKLRENNLTQRLYCESRMMQSFCSQFAWSVGVMPGLSTNRENATETCCAECYASTHCNEDRSCSKLKDVWKDTRWHVVHKANRCLDPKKPLQRGDFSAKQCYTSVFAADKPGAGGACNAEETLMAPHFSGEIPAPSDYIGYCGKECRSDDDCKGFGARQKCCQHCISALDKNKFYKQAVPPYNRPFQWCSEECPKSKPCEDIH